DRQRRFHHRITKAYLAITLSLFPAIAIIFLANKWVPMEMEQRVFYVNAFFFSGWLLLTIIGLFWDSYKRINRNYLLLGGILGLLVPISNGLVTGDWIWSTLANGQYFVFAVDFTWFLASGFALTVYQLALRNKETEFFPSIKRKTNQDVPEPIVVPTQ
ncbi:MAG: hypothetical protein AAF242_18190, partial [Bacteroidota bacterium]